MTHDEAPVLFHVAQQKSLDTGIPLGTLESRWGRTGIPLRSPRTAASATTSTSKEYKTGVSAGGGAKTFTVSGLFFFSRPAAQSKPGPQIADTMLSLPLVEILPFGAVSKNHTENAQGPGLRLNGTAATLPEADVLCMTLSLSSNGHSAFECVSATEPIDFLISGQLAPFGRNHANPRIPLKTRVQHSLGTGISPGAAARSQVGDRGMSG